MTRTHATLLGLLALGAPLGAAPSGAGVGHVRGLVLDFRGSPVALSEVAAYDAHARLRARSLSAADGSFELSLPGPDTYDVACASPEHAPGLRRDVVLAAGAVVPLVCVLAAPPPVSDTDCSQTSR